MLLVGGLNGQVRTKHPPLVGCRCIPQGVDQRTVVARQIKQAQVLPVVRQARNADRAAIVGHDLAVAGQRLFEALLALARDHRRLRAGGCRQGKRDCGKGDAGCDGHDVSSRSGTRNPLPRALFHHPRDSAHLRRFGISLENA